MVKLNSFDADEAAEAAAATADDDNIRTINDNNKDTMIFILYQYQ